MKRRHLELVVDNTKDDDIPLLDLKEELTGNDKRNGYLGWVATGAVVAAWDISRNETMTNAFKRGREHAIGRYALAGATTYIVAHLYDLIPEKYDLFDQIAKRFGKE